MMNLSATTSHGHREFARSYQDELARGADPEVLADIGVGRVTGPVDTATQTGVETGPTAKVISILSRTGTDPTVTHQTAARPWEQAIVDDDFNRMDHMGFTPRIIRGMKSPK